MRRLLLIFTIASIVGMYACEKADKSHKIVGRYKFEKVVIRDGIINTENITQDYNNMILLLDDAGRAELVDQNNNINYYGVYQYDEDVDTYYLADDDGGNYNNTNNSTILIDVSDTVRGRRHHFLGKNVYRTQNKLRFTVPRADGDYRYKLEKF